MQPTYYTSHIVDIESGLPIEWDEEFYDGVWESLKKGREAQQQVTQQSLDTAKANTAKQNEQYGAENTDIGTLEANSTPGSLSPAAQAQLASDKANIQNTYNNAASTGLARIAQHGMGTLTGENASLNNTLARSHAADDNAAYNQAQLNTHADQLAAIQARGGLQGLYSPVPALNTGSESALRQSQMGSTLGDIGRGVGAAVGAATGIGDAGGLASLPSYFMNG